MVPGGTRPSLAGSGRWVSWSRDRLASGTGVRTDSMDLELKARRAAQPLPRGRVGQIGCAEAWRLFRVQQVCMGGWIECITWMGFPFPW